MHEFVKQDDNQSQPPEEGGGGGDGPFIVPTLPDLDPTGPWVPWDGSPISIADLRIPNGEDVIHMPKRSLKF